MEKKKNDILDFIKSEKGKNHLHVITDLQRDKFTKALDREFFQRQLFSNDYALINESLSDWKSKLKVSDSRFKVLQDLELALLRMFIYVQTQDYTQAAAIAEYQIERSKNESLLSLNMELRKEIQSLKNEIEFITKNG